jgi:hypothetical protein
MPFRGDPRTFGGPPALNEPPPTGPTVPWWIVVIMLFFTVTVCIPQEIWKHRKDFR